VAVAQQPPKPHCGEMNVLKVGDMAPPFIATDIAGASLDLRTLTKDKQVVLLFYRGAWCPYCTKYMAELQEHLDEIIAKNAVVIAVSPEVEASGLKAAEKSGATFHVVHDTEYAIMCAYGTAYELSPEMKEKFKGYGIDLQATSATGMACCLCRPRISSAPMERSRPFTTTPTTRSACR